jgi:lycopene cyclase domain-containing protein
VTYLQLVAVFLLVSALPLAVAVVRRRPGARWWAATALTGVALVVLTAVFDTIMIGVDLFRYEESVLTGLYIGLAPIEDFAWPLAAVLVIPSLVLLLTPRTPEEER